MDESELRDAEDYVSADAVTGTLDVDHTAMIADLTGTGKDEWNDAEGPDSRVGDDFYYQHDDELRNARVNVDQSLVTITVTDEDGEEIASGSLDLEVSPTWSANASENLDDHDDDGRGQYD